MGFKPGTIAKGRFKRYESAGYSAQVTGYTSYGHIAGITFSGKSTTGAIKYEYQTFGDDVERVVSATYYGSGGESGGPTIRKALYTYYTDSEEHGSLGDLKTVTVQEYVEGKWVSIGTYYYRYHVEANGAHRVKYALDPQAYENLSNDPEVSDPLTATDAQVAQYANRYFEYGANGRVSKEVVLGGAETTFTYQDGDQTDSDFNHFKLQTVATRSDGHVHTRFTNFEGQPLLEETKESATADESTLEYREYDSDGNLVLHATPAALDGYSVDGYSITPQYKYQGGEYVGLKTGGQRWWPDKTAPRGDWASAGMSACQRSWRSDPSPATENAAIRSFPGSGLERV